MSTQVYLYLLPVICLFGCSPQKTSGEREGAVVRFDSIVYRYLESGSEAELSACADFPDVYGERVIGVGRRDSAGFYGRLKQYFSDATLRQIYADEQRLWADASAFEAELSAGLERLMQHCPRLQRPTVYLHVSGWGQNVIVTDDALSLSADKYLGAEYPLYSSFFYDYQRQAMTPDRMAPDGLLGFLMANFPFRGREEVLLERMIYEGKLRYLLSRLLPDRPVWEAVGYTKAQYDWCEGHRDRIWQSVLEQRHLFTPDYRTTSAYLNEAPTTTTLPSDSPGRVGVWLGFRIVAAYMARHPATEWEALLEAGDAAELLRESRF